MKQNFFIYIIESLCIILFSACNNDIFSEKEEKILEGEKILTMHLSQFSKVDVATRMGGIPDENRISRVAAIAYRNNKCIGVEMVYANDGNIQVSDQGMVRISLNKLMLKQDDLPLQKGDEIYILCNPPVYSESDFPVLPTIAQLGIETTSSATTYCLLTSPLTSDDKGYLIPMWTKITYGDNTVAEVERSVVKLTLDIADGILSGKKVEYKLRNAPMYGTMKDGYFNSNASVNYHNVTNGGLFFPINTPNYLFEYPHSTFGLGYSGAANKTKFMLNRTCIILKVDKEFYRIDFLNNQKEYFDLLRNCHYQFHIKEITERGYDTEEMALKHPGSNIVYDVIVENNKPAWSQKIYTNGQYTLFMDLATDYLSIPFPQGSSSNFTATVDDQIQISYRKEATDLPEPASSITITGEGIKKASSGATSITTSVGKIICYLTPSQFADGLISVELANIHIDIPVYRRFDADCHYMVYPFSDVTSAKVITPNTPWIELSTDCNSNLTYKKEKMSQTINSSPNGHLYVHLDENLNTSDNGTQLREAVIEIETSSGGIVHYCFRQTGIDYVGQYGGYLDQASNEYGLGAERLIEHIGDPVDYTISVAKRKTYWGFNSEVYDFADNADNGWETSWRMRQEKWSDDPDPLNAVNICFEKNRDLNGDGKLSPEEMKWYLPATNQLKAAFKSSKTNQNGNYYTSQANTTTKVWNVASDNSASTNGNRTTGRYIRCVRNMPLTKNNITK